MEYRGRQWHEHCFCCCLCQTPIGSNSFVPKDDEVYCECPRSLPHLVSLSLSL